MATVHVGANADPHPSIILACSTGRSSPANQEQPLDDQSWKGLPLGWWNWRVSVGGPGEVPAAVLDCELRRFASPLGFAIRLSSVVLRGTGVCAAFLGPDWRRTTLPVRTVRPRSRISRITIGDDADDVGVAAQPALHRLG